MLEAVKGFVAKRQKNGLLLLDMPTGSGKTYTTAQIIGEYLKGNILQEIKKIIYLTPLNKNVKDAIDELRKVDGLEKSVFDTQVLHIQANSQGVIDHLLDVEEDIDPVLTSKESFRELRKRIVTLRGLENQTTGDLDYIASTKATYEEDIRRKYEPAFRDDIKAELSRRETTTAGKLKLVKTKWKWLLVLYPAIRTSECPVLYMSVDKFCHGNDPIIAKKYSFSTANWLKEGTLIFIDEIDSAKEFILRSQIEESSKNKIDVFRLFSALTDSFASDRKFPSDNFPSKSVENFQKLKNLLLERRKNLGLDYSFKLDSPSGDERTFLFEDHSLHTISSKKGEKNLVVETDEKRRLNLIRIVGDNDKSNGSFYRLVYGLNGALRYTVTACTLISQDFLAEKHKKTKPFEDKMEPDQAVSTTLSIFGMDQSLEKALHSMVMNDFSFPQIRRKRNALSFDFYMEGFRYFDFLDEPTHDTITFIRMCYMNGTPEKFLFELCNQALVVGLSATATIETVTGNFNLDYIRKQLGDAYYVLPPADSARMTGSVQKWEDSKKYPIHVKEITLDKDDCEGLASSVFKNPDNVDDFCAYLSRFPMTKRDPLFFQKRIVRMMKAVSEFLTNEKGKAMLVLTNTNLKADQQKVFSAPYINGFIKRLLGEKGLVDNVKTYLLHGNSFEQEKQRYKADIQEGYKVILFSSYPSAGTGQNLQYSVMEGTEEESEMQHDIDTLYLEKPTNILVNVNATGFDDEKWLTEEDLIKYIYQSESLRNTGEVSPGKAQAMIKHAFKRFLKGDMTRSDSKENEYGTDSVTNHIVRTLVQAVGRICRTKDVTKPEVNIYVDEEIYRQVSFGVMAGKPMNQEFAALIAAQPKPVDGAKNSSRELHRGAERNERLSHRITALLADMKYSWRQEAMDSWRSCREWLLKHPVVDAPVSSQLEVLYLYSSDNKTFSSYWYGGNDQEYPLSYLCDNKHQSIVSEAESNLTYLMMIPEVKAYFEKHGYMTSWHEGRGLLVPVAFNNLYKGALGEEAGRAILESRGILLAEIKDPDKFEKFDYCLATDPDIYVDFKNWNSAGGKSELQTREHILQKLKRVNGKKAFIINMAGPETAKVVEVGQGEIVECPSLVKIAANGRNIFIDEDNLSAVVKKILEAK